MTDTAGEHKNIASLVSDDHALLKAWLLEEKRGTEKWCAECRNSRAIELAHSAGLDHGETL